MRQNVGQPNFIADEVCQIFVTFAKFQIYDLKISSGFNYEIVVGIANSTQDPAWSYVVNCQGQSYHTPW